MSVGRGTDGRTVTLTTTSGQAAVTAAAGTFDLEDVGRTAVATGIPAGATIATVTSDTAATLSANATASGSRSVALGAGLTPAYGFSGWSPETSAEAQVYSVAGGAGASDPARVTNTYSSGHRQRARG